jgi:hypothetical protein
MYENIKKDAANRKDVSIWVGLIFAIAVMLAVIIPVIIGARAQHVYHTMFREMAHSAVYSRNHASAWLYVGDEKYFYPAERTSELFTFLADGGSGKPQRERDLPNTEYVLLDYGDGATLQIWYAKVKGNYGGPLQDGLLLSYVNPEGKRYSYTTNALYVSELEPYLWPEAEGWLERGIAQMYP